MGIPWATSIESTSSSMANENTSTDEQKKLLLQAIAENGNAGRQAFQQAQSDLQSQKAAAMQAAMSRAAAVQAPGAFQGQIDQEVNVPYDTGIRSLTGQQATFDQDMARQAASAGTYLDKVKAAEPLAQAARDASTQRTISDADQANQERQQALTEALLGRQDNAAQRKYEAEKRATDTTREDELWRRKLEELGLTGKENAADRTNKLAIEQIQLEQARAGLANTRASGARAAASASSGGKYAGAGTPIADLLHGLGGQTAARIALKNPVQQAVSALLEDSKAHSIKAGRKITDVLGTQDMTKFRTAKQGNPDDFTQKALSKKEALGLVETNLGLPAGALDSILGKDSPTYVKPKSARQLSTAQTNQIRVNPLYQEQFQRVVGNLADVSEGKRMAAKRQEIAVLRQAPDYAQNIDVYEQIIRDL